MNERESIPDNVQKETSSSSTIQLLRNAVMVLIAAAHSAGGLGASEPEVQNPRRQRLKMLYQQLDEYENYFRNLQLLRHRKKTKSSAYAQTVSKMNKTSDEAEKEKLKGKADDLEREINAIAQDLRRMESIAWYQQSMRYFSEWGLRFDIPNAQNVHDKSTAELKEIVREEAGLDAK